MSEHDPSVAPLGVFGGTFNPVHFGHLRSALELVEKVGLQRLGLMPCAVPPLREAPGCSAAHRAAMVELAVAGEPRLYCDARELARDGKSYTYDSLLELRSEEGPGRSLCMVMGCDALLAINRWHRWRELLSVAHIVVIARPGWSFPDSGEVGEWLAQHRAPTAGALHAAAAGSIVIEELRPLAISSTEVRELLAAGGSVRYLVPESVLEYIEHNKLYG
ncbi:MAG: nicotinate-nucleotide adenylyltransferase [Halioglobus sp.]